MIEVDYNAVVAIADRPADQDHFNLVKAAVMGPPPLPRWRPPLRPRRPAEPTAAATAAGSANGSPDSSPCFSPQTTINHHQDGDLLPAGEEEEEQVELAKLMLSPEGLAAKKITLEGFAVPVSIRLLDRRQQHPQQQQQQAVASSRVAQPAALSITWIDLDTFGFDIGGLASVRRGGAAGEERSGHKAGALGRKRSWGGATRNSSGQESLLLVLSWGVGGAGPSDVAFELATPWERDLLASTLEMLAAGLADDTADEQEPSEREHMSSSRGTELGLQQSAGGIATTGGAAGNETRSSFDGRAPSSTAGAEADFPSRSTDTDFDPHAGTAVSRGLSRLSSSSETAATANNSRDLRDNATTLGNPAGFGIRRRGVSFGAAAAAAAGREFVAVPELTRSWTSGAVLGRGRESEEPDGLCQPEEEARRRRQEVMARLLAMYDRTRDEARAAAWRLGAMRLKRLLSAAATRQTESCWARWCGAVRRANEARQRSDRRLWYLHAKANQNNDLLAWYHATFCREVYRRRVPFWFRETQLKPYQKAYRIVDDGENSYTRWEKSVMSSCVCTVGTRYADVAAQLFTAKDVLTPEEYRLLLALVKRGAEVPKAASKSGRKFPHPMKLRVWFNKGALCLTAKREKPDSATTKDHSFYLSKVKTCVVALPAAVGSGGGRKGSGRVSRKHDGSGEPHAPDSQGSNSSSSSYGAGVESFDRGGVSGFPAPGSSGAKDSGVAGVLDAGGPDRRRSLSSPTAAIPAAAFTLPSPLHSPVPPFRVHGAGGGGFPHDEADRGAGGRSGDSQDGDGGGGGGGSSSEGGVNQGQTQERSQGRGLMSPAAALSGKDVGLDGAEGTSCRGRRHQQQQQQQPQHRVLSIHFFGRSITLDLWFASEDEAVEWQGMLTKLSWKEQGYLYRGSPPSPHELGSSDDEDERPREDGAPREMGAGAGVQLCDDERQEGEKRTSACRRGDDGGGGSSSGSGSRDGDGDESRVSPGPAPSPSSSCSSIVAADWAHATHGRPPPPPSPPPPPR